jgi:hypothetical protein
MHICQRVDMLIGLEMHIALHILLLGRGKIMVMLSSLALSSGLHKFEKIGIFSCTHDGIFFSLECFTCMF